MAEVLLFWPYPCKHELPVAILLLEGELCYAAAS